ncbi:MAG: multicopper oxidase domain-containing protein [Methyloglobulus sp.]|nr:multicopper oxidase domain-containing protein [Methyloglobulus sp.]
MSPVLLIPAQVQYTNTLSATLQHFLPVDKTIHGTMMGEPDIRSVVHLHGNRIVDQASDGFPEAWISPTGTLPMLPRVPPNLSPFQYTNNQEASLLWYHDHTIGMTRLNVFAGMAGLYIVRDTNEQTLITNNQLPSGRYEVPLVIQDRTFKLDGSLAYPDKDPNTLLGGIANPSVVPEFFGNVIVVNGTAWPYFQVEPKKYRLRLLNGSNARFYTMDFKFTDTTVIPSQDYYVPFQVIATDSGLLNAPVPATIGTSSITPTVPALTMAPAERYDIIIDFTGLGGKNITMTNSAPVPFGRTQPCTTAIPPCVPPGIPATGTMQGQIMQFKVNAPAVSSPAITIPAALRTPIVPLVNTPAHQVLLVETKDDKGRITPMLGTLNNGWIDFMGDHIDYTKNPIQVTPIGDTDKPARNSVQTWEIFNSTLDAHPIHLHDGAFQPIERQPFSAILGPGGSLTDICYSSTPRQPKSGTVVPACPPVTPPSPVLAREKGWKDTMLVYPSENNTPTINIGGIVKGQVTRVNIKFEGPGLFVWHCHITEHEDHDMMRPLAVR